MLLGQDPLAGRRNTTVVGKISVVRCHEDCLAIWREDPQRRVLTEMDTMRLITADQMRLAQDRSKTCFGSTSVARLENLPFALVLDLPRTEGRVLACVLRWPEREGDVRRALKAWYEVLGDREPCPATLVRRWSLWSLLS